MQFVLRAELDQLLIIGHLCGDKLLFLLFKIFTLLNFLVKVDAPIFNPSNPPIFNPSRSSIHPDLQSTPPTIGYLLTQNDGSFVGPSPADVSECVPAAAQQKRWHIEGFDLLSCIAVALHREVEAAQTVSTQTVSTALQHDRLRPVGLHDLLDDRLEDIYEGFVVQTLV